MAGVLPSWLRLTPSAPAVATIVRGTVLLSSVLVVVKTYYLGWPDAVTLPGLARHARSILAITAVDVAFAALLGLGAVMLAAAAGRRARLAGVITWIFLLAAAGACLYAVASVVMFSIFGGFLTYSLLVLVGDVQMLQSSVGAYLTANVATALVAIPASYLAVVWLTGRGAALASRGAGPARVWRRAALVGLLLAAWVGAGRVAYSRDWTTRQDRRIAENAHWVLASSWWHAVGDATPVRLPSPVVPGDMADFAPLGASAPAPPVRLLPVRVTTRPRGRAAAPPRQPNVILVVLEAVAARWTGLGGHHYETTPRLAAEARNALVFDSFYAHIGRSSNSLGSILLSTYPKLDFQDLTVEYPDLGGTSLARLFRDRGYTTSFVTPSDLQWAGWETFIGARGFDRVDDYRDLACSDLVSSWGVEDRCMIDGMIAALDKRGPQPFFMMGWSQQTHHPYEPTPGLPLLNLVREPVRDSYDLGRYLNVLRETDAHLGRLFDAIRAAGIANDTIVVVTGDHGQAFGYPHNTYIQGRTIYEEDVHVPLMIWSPRLPRAGTRVPVIGSHVDLAPTIAQLAGLPAGPDWQGRTLFGSARAPRAYFYVAEDHFRLGVREGRWKYIYDLREGSDELFDLAADPDEQRNLATREPARATRLRQRLAAWAEANRLQYARVLRQPGNGI